MRERRSVITAAFGAVAVLGVLVAVAPVPIAQASAGALMVAGLFVVPRFWLPALTLMSFVLVPVKWLPVPAFLLLLTPSALVVLVWTTRMFIGPAVNRFTPSDRVPRASIAFVGLLLVGALRVAGSSSGVWTLSFLCLGLLPLVLTRREPQASEIIVGTWLVLAGILGAYAGLERVVLHGNPVLDWAYDSAARPIAQNWGSYRATTTLGHPLVNATFFVCGLCLALGRWRHSHSNVELLCALFAGVGVAATASRGGLIAMCIGGLVTVASPILARGRASGRVKKVALVGAVVILLLVGGLGATTVLARGQAVEASSSIDYRVTAAAGAVQLVKSSPVLGVGPGRAAEVKASGFGPLGDVPFENSWLELAVALGIPATLLLGHLLLAACRRALRAGDPGVAGAIVAFGLMLASFNLLEGHRSAHVLVGLLLGTAFATTPKHSYVACHTASMVRS